MPAAGKTFYTYPTCIYRGGYFWQIFGSEGVQPPPRPPHQKAKYAPTAAGKAFYIYRLYPMCIYREDILQ